MSLPIVFRPEARAELIDAWTWYEEQRPGLGDELEACVEAAIGAAARSPAGHLAATGNSEIAVAASLRRLRKARRIGSPRRGFHVIVPLEYRATGAPSSTLLSVDELRATPSHRTDKTEVSP